MPSQSESETSSTWIGFVFIFNLIVGTGALTLPAAFAKSGWLLSLIVIVVLAVISYMTATFIIETIACANAVRSFQILECEEPTANGEEDDELLGYNRDTEDDLQFQHIRLRNIYKLDKKFELGEMAKMFFNEFGRMVFYLCLVIYLYGDLSIYAAAVAKTLRDISCDPQNLTHEISINSSGLRMINLSYHSDQDNNASCWQQHTTHLTRLNVYRIYLVAFITLLGPFTFARNVQKTKYLQILTVICRWTAFILMISIAIKLIISNGAKGHPVAVNFYGVPPLFGACVYSFMCHHSLPSIIFPISNKNKIHSLLSLDYALICLFYILLAMIGIFAFSHLEDLFTLNFIPSTGDGEGLLLMVDYFLALFPVFTLSTSFPIIAITLRNNLQTLFLDTTRIESYSFFIRHMLFPLLAIVPPFIITYFTQNLTSLVAFTGSYAGSGIQYFIPISLVFFARRTCKELLGNGVRNPFESLFQNDIWLIFVLLWSIFCTCLVTINFLNV